MNLNRDDYIDLGTIDFENAKICSELRAMFRGETFPKKKRISENPIKYGQNR